MKQAVMAVSVSALLAVVGVRSAQAQNDEVPTKVSGGSTFLDWGADAVSGSFQPCSFMLNVNPVKKAGAKSPQAVVQVDGETLRDFWGGPLTLKGDFVFSYPIPFEDPDPKPGQAFLFLEEHPVYGPVHVWVFAHDNVTPGYDRANPGWSDWFGVWIELPTGNGVPDNGIPGLPNDDLFIAMGIVTQGNIMDQRK